jgi:hypothetical protein
MARGSRSNSKTRSADVLHETVYFISPLSGGKTKELGLYAQNIFRIGLAFFYPKRMNFVKKSQENAKELGQLQAPLGSIRGSEPCLAGASSVEFGPCCQAELVVNQQMGPGIISR